MSRLPPGRWLSRMLVAAAGAIALAAPATAQSTDPDAARAKELVTRIRRSMREIDALLLQGAPGAAEAELAANQRRIEELLRETEAKSQSVIQNLEALIELGKPG